MNNCSFKSNTNNFSHACNACNHFSKNNGSINGMQAFKVAPNNKMDKFNFNKGDKFLEEMKNKRFNGTKE